MVHRQTQREQLRADVDALLLPVFRTLTALLQTSHMQRLHSHIQFSETALQKRRHAKRPPVYEGEFTASTATVFNPILPRLGHVPSCWVETLLARPFCAWPTLSWIKLHNYRMMTEVFWHNYDSVHTSLLVQHFFFINLPNALDLQMQVDMFEM